MDTRDIPRPFAIPSNKFYPPHIDESQSLLRTGLLNSKLPHKIRNKKAIIIEAQAGQGKTTLVSQFINHHNIDFIWYQIGPEDSDPVLLLSSLLANFNQKFTDFYSPQLSTILRDGVVGPLDLKKCANILLGDLNIYLQQDMFIVFDDLHLLTGSILTNNLLEYMIDTSPPRLHFILISRHPLEMKCKTFRDSSKISYLSTSDLALDNREIEDLFTNVFERDITRQDAIDIHRMTNGWIMGIVLASHPMSGRNHFWQNSTNDSVIAPDSDQGHMLDYFQDEIFDKIPEELHTPFFRLSFISEIPVQLATILTGIEDVGNILSEMARENFFVYRLDDNKSVFRFHHFFQEFLQLQGTALFSNTEIQSIHTREAEYYLELDMVEKALACYRKAEDYLTMDRILQTRGMELVSKNRTFTIFALLNSIPKETLFEYNWLTFFAGLMQNDYSPQTTLPYYERAIELFMESRDPIGEILCLSQMIYFHFVITGKYNVGSRLLPNTAHLLKAHEQSLPDTVKILAARNLACGHCFFDSQMDKARNYIHMANTLSKRYDSRNFQASARFTKGYIELLCGNRAKFLREAEKCYSLSNDPLVGMSNKLTIHVMYLCYLSMVGDFLNFKIAQEAIQKSIDRTIVDQTVAAPYIYVWGAACYISMGQTDTSMELLNKGFGITSTASSHHMHSQLLQWLAYGHALQGSNEEAVHFIEESITLRSDTGGVFYELFNNIMAGAIYARTGRGDKAAALLDDGVARTQLIPSTFLHICALFQRSYCKLVYVDTESALDDLEAGLSLMKSNGYTHFWGWEPVMMTKLLTLAVQFDIERSFAQMLCQERLKMHLGENGEPTPLLNFSLLDSFQISLGTTIISHSKDLTPSQRELLGLLITAKGQRISQERIQLELWPDNTPENARKSFDTLLTRLRKELSKNEILQVRDYIHMQKGILCLSNYQMDSLQFTDAARRGIVHAKNSDWWQAGNAFQHALYHWKGSLPEDSFKSEQVLTYNDQLANTLIEFTTTWARHMAETGRTDEAIALIERVLQTNKLEEELVTLLYALHSKNNSPIKAKETLERYKVALKKVEYSQREIDEYIEVILATAKETVFEQSSSSY
ncbi:BTAD domain-containing putative transcriptional regulator [Desulfosediminicola sp.]|uniref:BTAD domain-containing putative transcriptional regulator n=1 Tax=Desulfosediminicola sp. TaxID=2886825 RepID=UPI003AF21E18